MTQRQTALQLAQSIVDDPASSSADIVALAASYLNAESALSACADVVAALEVIVAMEEGRDDDWWHSAVAALAQLREWSAPQ